MKQYLKKRRVAALIVLAAGIVVAFFLVVSSSSEEKPFISIVENGNDERGGYRVGAGRGDLDLNLLNIGTDNAANTNLTQTLAQNYVESTYNLNSENPTGTGDTLRMPGSGSIDDLLSRALSQNLEFPSFTEKDILTTNDNSAESKRFYIDEVSRVSKKNFEGFTVPINTLLDNLFTDNDPSQLGKYVTITQNQMNDLLALEVPSQLKVWHLESLNLWRKKFVTFSILLDFNSDPLKAALASKEVPLIMEEGYNLDKTINALAAKL